MARPETINLSIEEFVTLGDLSPTDIVAQVMGWAKGDRKRAQAMLDGFATRATMSQKPKFLVAKKLFQQGS